MIDGAQASGVHVRVALRRGQGGVAEHLLHGAQIRAALQQVGRRRVAQPGGAQCRARRPSRPFDGPMERTTRGSMRPPSVAEEERAAAGLPSQLGSASYEPVIEGVLGWRTIGNDALLVTFAKDTHGQCLSIER